MVPSIARQSVIFKCTRQQSVLLGNYEFYYVAGLMNRCFGLSAREEMPPLEMFSYLSGQLENLQPKDENEKYMIKILSNYDPLEDYDDQMKDLFRWGEKEQDLWKVQTNYTGG